MGNPVEVTEVALLADASRVQAEFTKSWGCQEAEFGARGHPSERIFDVAHAASTATTCDKKDL